MRIIVAVMGRDPDAADHLGCDVHPDGRAALD